MLHHDHRAEHGPRTLFEMQGCVEFCSASALTPAFLFLFFFFLAYVVLAFSSTWHIPLSTALLRGYQGVFILQMLLAPYHA